ncbi:hypothetical protein HC928_25275, partial [bacterium]|nr:hypothetical protein [bacterium]
TGEMYSLSPEEHLAVVKATLDEAEGKVPVLTGVGFNYPIAIQQAKNAAKAGVDGILALPPYFPHADEQGLFDYYKAIGNACKRPFCHSNVIDENRIVVSPAVYIIRHRELLIFASRKYVIEHTLH